MVFRIKNLGFRFCFGVITCTLNTLRHETVTPKQNLSIVNLDFGTIGEIELIQHFVINSMYKCDKLNIVSQ